jgi:hypothetical protein
MAFNIMDLVKDQITPENIGAIAGMLGEDEKKTATGISGVIPSILGGLIDAVAKPEGEKAFGQAIEQADTGLVGNLLGALGGDDGSSLASSGTKMLGALFGDNKLTSLIGAIAGFSGLSKGSSKSLLGVAAPMLISLLAKKGKSDSMDSKGLINMLLGQKDNIAKAMPPALGQSLSGLGLIDQPAAAPRTQSPPPVSSPPPQPPRAQPAPAAAAPAQPEQKKKGSILGKLVVLVILALVALLAYQFLTQPKMAPSSSAAAVQQKTGMSVDEVIALKDEIGGLISDASKTLAGVTNAASAKAALPKLQGIDTSLEKAVNLVSTLPPAQGKTLGNAAAGLLPGLQRTVDAASGVPGADEIIGTTVGSIMSTVNRLVQG